MLKFLKTDQDFAAFRASKSFQTKFLKIRVRYSSNQNHPRFGFIVPKKIMPKVVDRNLVKRRLKSILTKLMMQLKPADVVFYPQQALVKMKFSQLAEEVEQLFKSARLWK